jgi:hypothetical protein
MPRKRFHGLWNRPFHNLCHLAYISESAARFATEKLVSRQPAALLLQWEPRGRWHRGSKKA